jgi:lysophospholipase L1-like esterase
MQLTFFKTSKGLLVTLVIVVQLLIVIYLGFKIYQQKTKVLGTEVIIPIEKESLIFNPDSDLEFFYEPKPNTIDNNNPWVPYKAIYTINSDSLNERLDYALEKPEKTFRIITLGDSYTYGLYVDTENNFSERLEDILNKTPPCGEYSRFEVINLGIGGYDIQYASERYRLRGQKYSPDLVIWFIKNDDMIQINEIMLPEEKIIAKELKESGDFDKLVEKGEFYPSWNRAVRRMIDQYGKDSLLELSVRFLEEFPKSYPNPLLIITFPSTKDDYKEVLEQFAASQSNIFFHDEIPEIFGIEGAAFPNDGHPTVLGHDLIAKNLFEYLTEENSILCSPYK